MNPYKIFSITLFIILACTSSIFAQFGNTYELTDAIALASDSKLYDLDGDGDLDVLGTSWRNGRIVWYENQGGGVFGYQNVLSKDVVLPRQSVAADYDNDGDLDVFSTIRGDDELVFFENLGGGNFSDKIYLTIATNAHAIVAEDMNSDGFVDLLYTRAYSNKVYWLENMNGQNFASYGDLIATVDNPETVFAADLNGDGDMDVVSASYDDNEIIWFENQGNGTFGNQIVISTSVYFPKAVYAFDVDADGDQDVLSVSRLDDKIAWYPNNGLGVFGAQQIISITTLEPHDITAGDMDSDGDLDVIVPSSSEGTVSWYENQGSGNFGTEQIVSTGVIGAQKVYTGDIDQDGNVDVVSSAWTGEHFYWHKNNGVSGFAPKQVVSINSHPNPISTVADLDQDGDLDVLSSTTEAILWFENLGNNSFSKEKIIVPDLISNYSKVISVDVDEDLDMDVIWLDLTDSLIVWNENLGSGNFATKQHISDTLKARTIEIGDLSGDGLIDIIVTKYNSEEIFYFENDASGEFAPPLLIINEPLATGYSVNAIVLEDIDNDNQTDILIGQYGANQAPHNIAWHKNLGNGSFSTEIVLSATFNGPTSVEVIDIDNDGDKDVLATNGNAVMIWIENLGGGLFNPEQTLSSSAGYRMVKADVDNDGDYDILIGHSDEFLWYENLDNGLLGPLELISDEFNSVGRPTVADFDDDGDLDLVISDASSNETIIMGNSLYYGTQVSGRIFLDMNANQVLDSTEYGTSGIGVMSNPQSDYTYTYSDGNYFMNFSDTLGDYQLSPQTPQYWSVSTDSLLYNVSIDSIFVNMDSLDFGFKPDTIITDIEVDLVGGFPRCNWIVNYWLNFENIGTTLPSGIIKLELHDSVSYVSSFVVPDSIVGNDVYWSYDSLFYFTDNQIAVQVQMPDFNSIGNVFEAILTVSELDSQGVIAETFSDTLSQEIVCAYDPNDKIATPTGIDSLGFVASMPNEIEYTVRFQNTGNDTVFVVVITDQLDTNLIWQSLVPIAGSHPFQTGVDQNGELTFTFDNIMLPDSNVNEIASHGFVKYRIGVKPGITPGTSIYNTANIFFDLNPAVVTNTKIHTLYDCLQIDYSVPQSICVGDSLLGNVTDNFATSVFSWDISGVYNGIGTDLGWLADSAGVFDLTIYKTNNICPLDTTIQMTVSPLYSTDLGAASICQGDSILVFNQYVSSAGTYYDSLQTINGCDSIFMRTISINPVALTSSNQTICQGDSIVLFNDYVSLPGTYYDTLQTAFGCDSVISKTLSTNAVFLTTNNLSICDGDSVLLGGQYQINPGIYIDSMQSVTGCDSLLQTTLNLTPVFNSSQDETICVGDSALIFGQYQNTAGIYSDSLQTVTGCDSVVHINLIVNTSNIAVSSTDTSLITSTSGTSYQWLDCDDNFAPVIGETSQEYYPNNNGSYAVEIDQFGCIDTSACFVISTINLDENGVFKDVMIFPNPNTGTVNIYLGQLKDIDLTISDPTGKVIYTEANIAEELHQLELTEPAGIYFIEICKADDCTNYRLVKQ